MKKGRMKCEEITKVEGYKMGNFKRIRIADWNGKNILQIKRYCILHRIPMEFVTCTNPQCPEVTRYGGHYYYGIEYRKLSKKLGRPLTREEQR